MPTHPKLSLIEHFKDLPDPRVQGRTDHELIDVLVIAVCTLLCGGSSFDDMADFLVLVFAEEPPNGLLQPGLLDNIACCVRC